MVCNRCPGYRGGKTDKADGHTHTHTHTQRHRDRHRQDRYTHRHKARQTEPHRDIDTGRQTER